MMQPSAKLNNLLRNLRDFVNNECIPAEKIYAEQVGQGAAKWEVVPEVLEGLKSRAKELGLWNLFLPSSGLSNWEYSWCCEVMGRAPFIAPEACNCSAPDTGNMEVLEKYGSKAQQERWLEPLLKGEIRSAFAMTEPQVASSDALNISTLITKRGDGYQVNGRKWWISGAGDPRCKFFLVMGKSGGEDQARHKRHTLVIVPKNTPGLKIIRSLTFFGYDDAPIGHCELLFENVHVPAENVVLGEGRGFEVVQGRLGPGRLHHCMRAVGMAERALELMIKRMKERSAFGHLLQDYQTLKHEVATSRIEIEQARLLVLYAANRIDEAGPKAAKKEIAIAKVAVPKICLAVIDRAIQVHGAAGLGPDFPLAQLWAFARTLRVVDGPDAVHLEQIAKLELLHL